MIKFDKFFFYTAAIIPWGLIISILLFYIHASILLGRFPTYANPDPKALSIYNSYAFIINPLFFAWALTFFIWIIAFIIFINHNNNSLAKYKKPLIIIFAGQLTSLLIFFTPIVNWYLD